MKNYLNKMIQKATKVMKNSYSPYSHFPVGSCIRTVDGDFFVGCNVENSSYSMTICAESVAITSMVAAGKKEISDILIIANHSDDCPPCGACLQRLTEFSSKETKIHWCGVRKEGVTTFQLSELLTKQFDRHYLTVDSAT